MAARPLLCLLALALALGALLVGHGLILPSLGEGAAGLDANMARAIRTPLAARVSGFAFGSIALLAALRFWDAPRSSLSTLSALALVVVGLDLFYFLPELKLASSRVDLVSMGPATEMALFGRAQLMHQLAVATSSVLLAAVLLSYVQGPKRPSKHVATEGAPDAAHAAHAAHAAPAADLSVAGLARSPA